MSFWDFIGEFFLFRWLFCDSRQRDEHDNVSESRDYYDDHDYDYGRNHQSFDDFHEEQDDYDMMDDFL